MQPDDLYGLPLDRFVPERTALSKALRAGGRRDAANAVAALRRPSVAAWAVNQLVRSQGTSVGALFDAGEGLRAAQEKLLAGSGDGRALRAASKRERAAVDELVQAARGLLDSDGHELSAAVVERVSETLHAAALDPDACEQVRPGRLERELRHVGLGLGESLFAGSAPAPAKAKPKQPKPSRQAAAAPTETKAELARAAREQAAARKKGERAREAARKAARAQENAARRRLERSAAALRVAHERRERAAGALAAAQEALAAAQTEAQAAAAEHERARAELEQL